MTDLKIDAQKVMTALELCSKEGQFVDCTDCPYEGSEKPVCINSLMRDALAMLKAQEPRVMTLEEVRDEAEYMYLEKYMNALYRETGIDMVLNCL